MKKLLVLFSLGSFFSAQSMQLHQDIELTMSHIKSMSPQQFKKVITPLADAYDEDRNQQLTNNLNSLYASAEKNDAQSFRKFMQQLFPSKTK